MLTFLSNFRSSHYVQGIDKIVRDTTHLCPPEEISEISELRRRYEESKGGRIRPDSGVVRFVYDQGKSMWQESRVPKWNRPSASVALTQATAHGHPVANGSPSAVYH